MPHFCMGESERHGLPAVVEKDSQFGFRCWSKNMLDYGEHGEDETIIDAILFVGKK